MHAKCLTKSRNVKKVRKNLRQVTFAYSTMILLQSGTPDTHLEPDPPMQPDTLLSVIQIHTFIYNGAKR